MTTTVSAVVTEKLLNYSRTRHGNATDCGLYTLGSITIYIGWKVTIGRVFSFFRLGDGPNSFLSTSTSVAI